MYTGGGQCKYECGHWLDTGGLTGLEQKFNDELRLPVNYHLSERIINLFSIDLRWVTQISILYNFLLSISDLSYPYPLFRSLEVIQT